MASSPTTIQGQVPFLQMNDRISNQVQQNIRHPLNQLIPLIPFVSNPLAGTVLLQSVSLASGANSIPHTLGRNLLGWFITRLRGSYVQIYDTQDTNLTPSTTLALNASSAIVVDIFVF
jgi:hypothetical protein